MINFQQVSKRYSNGYQALDNVNFQIAPGEFVFLTGHSGAGKSTILKLIAAIEPASQGNIVVNKQSLQRLRSSQIPSLRRNMGIILQTSQLLNDRSILENVALPLVIAGYSYHDIKSRVRAVLAKVSLQNKEKYYPHELSTGEQQRVAIARAMVNKPAILLADEPTGNLDPKLAAEIMYLFEQFNQLGMTVFIVSHDIALIHQLKHRVIKLAEGKLSCA